MYICFQTATRMFRHISYFTYCVLFCLMAAEISATPRRSAHFEEGGEIYSICKSSIKNSCLSVSTLLSIIDQNSLPSSDFGSIPIGKISITDILRKKNIQLAFFCMKSSLNSKTTLRSTIVIFFIITPNRQKISIKSIRLDLLVA